MGLIENTLCNTLYGQRTGQGETYAVHEEMLCVGDFSTGKSICKVSKVISTLPLHILLASVSLGTGLCVASALFVESRGLPVSSPLRVLLGSIPQKSPLD